MSYWIAIGCQTKKEGGHFLNLKDFRWFSRRICNLECLRLKKLGIMNFNTCSSLGEGIKLRNFQAKGRAECKRN